MTGIRPRLARVTAADPERQLVAVADAEGGGELGYDTLLYALGSQAADRGVPRRGRARLRRQQSSGGAAPA